MTLTDLMNGSYVLARRIVVAVIGATLVLLGGVLLFIPGPGVLVISGGLAVLALEFAWARHWLHKIRDAATEAGRAAGVVKAEPGSEPEPPTEGEPPQSSGRNSSRL